MFLVAIVVVLLSILYLYYGQLDAPSEPEPLTAGTGEPAAHGIPERLSHGDVQGEHRTSHSVQSLLHIYFGSQTGKADQPEHVPIQTHGGFTLTDIVWDDETNAIFL